MKYRKYSIAAVTASAVLLIVLSAATLTGAADSKVVGRVELIEEHDEDDMIRIIK